MPDTYYLYLFSRYVIKTVQIVVLFAFNLEVLKS